MRSDKDWVEYIGIPFKKLSNEGKDNATAVLGADYEETKKLFLLFISEAGKL